MALCANGGCCEERFTEPSNITLGDWLLIWLSDYKKGTLSQRSFERYIELSRKCLPLTDIKLQSITAPMIQNLYNTLSANTINKVHKVLNGAFKKAVQINLINRNIIEAVDSPKFDHRREIITFTNAEINSIFTTAKSSSKLSKYYPIILLVITTGARIGNCLLCVDLI